jgi:hypothetical protein
MSHPARGLLICRESKGMPASLQRVVEALE